MDQRGIVYYGENYATISIDNSFQRRQSKISLETVLLSIAGILECSICFQGMLYSYIDYTQAVNFPCVAVDGLSFEVDHPHRALAICPQCSMKYCRSCLDKLDNKCQQCGIKFQVSKSYDGTSHSFRLD